MASMRHAPPRLVPLAAVLALAAALLAPAPAAAVPGGGYDRPWAGLRLGGVLGVGSARPGTPAGQGGGVFALFDSGAFFGEVGGDFLFGDATYLAAGLGGYVPLAPGSVTPYVGGGLRLGWTDFGGDGAFGLMPYAAGGVLLGRGSQPLLRLEVAWFVSGAREERTDGRRTRAHGPMATLGIAF
jgi:hypothetical protein